MTDRRHRMRRLALGLALWAAFPLAWLLRSVRGSLEVSVCLFRTVTGKPCPFCGLTRAFGHATHGELVAASAAHPGWWLFALVVAGLGLAAVLDAARGRDELVALGRAWQRWGWYVVAAIVAVALLG